MKTAFTFLLFIIVESLSAQDYLSTLRENHILSKHSNTALKPRSGSDSVNLKITWDPLYLPFLDDFSVDRRTPSDFSPFLPLSEYYVTGNCIKNLDYKEYSFPFSTTPSQTYFFVPTNPPDYNGFFANSPILFSLNDTPNCTTLVAESIYPPTRKRTYSSTGEILTDTLISDTNITCAWVKEYFLKGYLWTDRFAYVNTHIPFMPMSKGVATLDGLNENGRPYNNDITNAYGLADYLTSVPIYLTDFSANDSAYLSFFYQPQGYGDWPNYQDSIMVEFLDDRGRWNTVWTQHGLTKELDIHIDSMPFKQVLIPIPDPIVPSDPIYYHDKFQFRFKNYATISGNNDHWHIDFVRLDTGRNYVDTTIKDANFVYELPSVLKNYTLLPAKQYRGHTDLEDSIIAINRNIQDAPTFSAFNYRCYNENTGTQYGNNSGIPFSANPIVYHSLFPVTNLLYPNSVEDSTYITTKIFLDNTDNIIFNDTATNRQFFFNEMAYDDGTAEMAYGLQGLGTKKMAYKFFIPNKDTLAAVKILFSNIDVNVSNLIFNLSIWKSIGINGNLENEIKTISNLKPVYIDTLNNYALFGLDNPIEVQDTIYVGWVQADERNLQIGYDVNSTKGYDNIYIFTNNLWSKSNIITKGSPMIRLILDGKRDYRTNKVLENSMTIAQSIPDIYPNPASDYVRIESEDYKSKEISIYNLLGKLVYQSQWNHQLKIDVSAFQKGLYMIQILENGKSIHSTKLMIER